jgi:hypothetical protein
MERGGNRAAGGLNGSADNKTMIQGVTYRMDCWGREQLKRRSPAAAYWAARGAPPTVGSAGCSRHTSGGPCGEYRTGEPEAELPPKIKMMHFLPLDEPSGVRPSPSGP